MKFLGRICAIILVSFLAAGGVMAQTTRGDIQGRVVDEAGVALPGVTVAVQSDVLATSKATVTDGDGVFKFLVLPPGTYSVTFNLSGFQARQQAEMAVKIGSTTRVDVIMVPAFTDELVVTSETPLVNTTSTTIGIDLTSDFYGDLPTGRNYTSVANVTPGAQADGSGQTFYGSSGAENAYYIDGANTTGVELGQQGKNLNFEFIDEVQVKSGSYNAEYGRATGSVISVITKSGGNEFHGDLFAYYDAADLQAGLDSAPAAGPINGSFVQTDFTRADYGLDIGGYIIKDALWFFAAYDRVDNQASLTVLQDFSSVIQGGSELGQLVDQEIDADLWATKLTWRISPNHNLSGSVFGDPRTDVGVRPNRSNWTLAATPLNYTGETETGGVDFSVNYDGVFGQNIVISGRVAQHNEVFNELGPGHLATGYIDFTDPLGNNTTIAGWDAGGGSHQRTSGFWNHQVSEFGRDQYNADLSWFVSDLAGSHEFKIGYEFEDITVVNESWNGGAGQRIYRFTCDPTARYCGEPGEEVDYYYRHRIFLSSDDLDPTQLTPADIQAPIVVDTKAENQAFFVQDSWQVMNNLTLDLGVRFGAQKLFNALGGVSADIDDNVAPRLGFVWDFLGNGKSKAYGHWGKFFETIPMDIVIRSYGAEISIFSYNLSDDPNDVASDPRVRSSRILGGISRTDPNTRGQYIEEYVVGVEYEFAPDWAAGVKYISRDLGRVIEDALAADGDYFIGNPSLGEMTHTFDIGYAYGYNEVLHAVPKPERTFEGIEFTLQKRFSNNFQFIASALFSSLEGNYDGTFQASTGQLDPNLNSAYDYYDFAVHNEGKLSNDLRYQWKFDGIYRFDFGLSTGLSAFYRDGVPITAMGYSAAYNNYEYYLSFRGVGFGRVDKQYEADLHFGYPVRLGSDFELNLLLDIFNVFNRQGETLRSFNYTDANLGTYEVVDWNTGDDLPPITPNSTLRPPTAPEWNTANVWQNPTTVRLGVRLSF